jgi:hypothetical protein
MSNNVLASVHGLQQLEKIVDIGCKVDFNQGLVVAWLQMGLQKYYLKSNRLDSSIFPSYQ